MFGSTDPSFGPEPFWVTGAIGPCAALCSPCRKSFVPSQLWQLRFTTHLAASPSRSQPTIRLRGVISYLVVQRTHEIAIRIALGAQKADVFYPVIDQGMTLAFEGAGIGVAGAFGLSRIFTSLLYDVKPANLLTIITASALLAVVAVLACYIRAVRGWSSEGLSR